MKQKQKKQKKFNLPKSARKILSAEAKKIVTLKKKGLWAGGGEFDHSSGGEFTPLEQLFEEHYKKMEKKQHAKMLKDLRTDEEEQVQGLKSVMKPSKATRDHRFHTKQKIDKRYLSKLGSINLNMPKWVKV